MVSEELQMKNALNGFRGVTELQTEDALNGFRGVTDEECP
jgi:hypothetical protein